MPGGLFWTEKPVQCPGITRKSHVIIRLPDQRGAKPPNGQPPPKKKKKIFASSAFGRAANLSVVPLLLRPAAHTTTRNYKHATTHLSASFCSWVKRENQRENAVSQTAKKGNGLHPNRIWSLEYFSFPFSVSTPGKEEEEKEKSGGKHIGPVGRSFFGWARAQCSDSEDRESVAPNGSISIANTYTHTHTQYSVAQHTLQSRLLQSYLGPGHYY